MSFRELRNLTEMMRALGYPRPISMENFRKPNFELVSDLLYWMVKKYDPSSSITEEIDTEEDRVQFLTQVATEVLTKARIRLNPKKLYAADGFAVKELIKLARVLYEASRIDVPKLGGDKSGAGGDDDDNDEVSVKSLLGSRVKDPKATRALSSEITQSGAKLFELLETELDVRDLRVQALRFLDALSNNSDSNSSEQKFLDKSLKDILQNMHENVEMTERQCIDLEAEEKALSAKIKKAQTDLERSEKRLKSLQHVRPAFMDEYEKLEKELERQYAVYCERFRNLDYLQRELDLHNAREMKKLAENDRSLKKMQKKFREDELAILRGEQEDQLDGGGSSLLEPSENNKNSNNGRSSSGAKGATGNGNAKGAVGKSGATNNNNNGRKATPGSNQKQAATTKTNGGRGANGAPAAANKKRGVVDEEEEDEDEESGSGSEDESGSGSGSDDEDGATSDESGGGGGRGAARAGGGGDASDSDEVSLADSGELIDNDDESGSDASEGSKSGSGNSGSETNSDSDQDF